MKYLSITLCLAVSVLALSACETSNTYDSGASYAAGRTAGNVTTEAVVYKPAATKTEKVFSKQMAK